MSAHKLNQTLKLIKINSTEWQKSDDHTQDQCILTPLDSLGFQFPNKEIDTYGLVHASTGTGQALILQQEMRDLGTSGTGQ